MAESPSFARIVSLACHDLRSPLATVHGFARTIGRASPLTEQATRHLRMIEEASAQMGTLLDDVTVLARIEGARYMPTLVERDSLELARAAAERVREGEVEVDGIGAGVSVDQEPVERGLAALARCALRHGGLERVRMDVRGAEIVLSPTTAESRPVLAGEELRDLGTEVMRSVLGALGGSLAVEEDSVVVRLPE